jgi:glycosyltransferase involved in cell wall biosynthesis
MVTDGYDALGEKKLAEDEFTLLKPPSLGRCMRSCGTSIVKKLLLRRTSKKQVSANKNTLQQFPPPYQRVPPFRTYTFRSSLVKWLSFGLQLVDNFVVLAYLLLYYRKQFRSCHLVIGYECKYTLAAKCLAKLFQKKYVNKYQGTILVATQSLWEAVKYYPTNFFGINASDLCIMVNDGTNGLYYAQVRGCKNIYFKPHGVKQLEEPQLQVEHFKWLQSCGDCFFFNNASASSWKRVDRIVKAVADLPESLREKCKVLTTYYGADLPQLKNYAESLGVSKNIIFTGKIQPALSQYLLKKSRALISTNDLSNLGNPVLEAIYFGTPVISLQDESVQGFLHHHQDSWLVLLDKDFERNFAVALEKLMTDEVLYQKLVKHMKLNKSVSSLDKQQHKEYFAIRSLCEAS